MIKGAAQKKGTLRASIEEWLNGLVLANIPRSLQRKALTFGLASSERRRLAGRDVL
jgi:hypothetical protein